MTDERRELDDTDLEWYGLAEEDIEKIKNEKDEIGEVDSKELLLASEITEMFYLRFWVELNLDEIIVLIRKNWLLEKWFNKNNYENEKIYC